MESTQETASTTEEELNAQLRRVDWRFLLRVSDIPRTLDMTSSEALGDLRLVAEDKSVDERGVDLALLGFPTRAKLRRARAVLRPGGEVICHWRLPRPFGIRAARHRLRRQGFVETRAYWPGPQLHGQPEFWAPLHSRAAMDRLLSMRPSPRRRLQAVQRFAWRRIESLGLLAPVFIVAHGADARISPSTKNDAPGLPSPETWILLTGGDSIYSKAVALAVENAAADVSTVVKFARVPASDDALEREARALRWLKDQRPNLVGVPRLVALGRRAGRRALAQSALHGAPMKAMLTPENFESLASKTADWLVELAGNPAPQPPSSWHERLVSAPLGAFEHLYGDLAQRANLDAARDELSQLSSLPLVCEHRDLVPNNVHVAKTGGLMVLDWEFAEPEGLPGGDLCFFLAGAAFVTERVLEDPAAPQQPILECHRRLLDPETSLGQAYQRIAVSYCDRLGLSRETFERLRLLCWIVQAVNRTRNSREDTTQSSDPDPFHPTLFARLAVAEVDRLRDRR